MSTGMSTADPLSLLQKMQQESLATAPGLPEEVEAADVWSGVGFRVGDIHLVTPLDHVSEVLQWPDITPVPRTRPWLKGIANVRGNLLTIIDLPEFFGKEPVRIDDRCRVMTINVPSLNAGLLVNEVFGLRHFDPEQERQQLSGLDDPVMAQTEGAFLRGNTLWGIFDVKALAENPKFMHVHMQ